MSDPRSSDVQPTAVPAPRSLGRRIWTGLRIAVTCFIGGAVLLGVWGDVTAHAPLGDILPALIGGAVLTAIVWWAFPILAIVALFFIGSDD